MLFVDNSCVSENSILTIEEKGIFTLMEVEWASIIILSNSGKAVIETERDLSGIGRLIPEKALEEYKYQILHSDSEYCTINLNDIYLSFFLIRTDSKYKVYYYFVKTKSEFSEKDIIWFNIYNKKAYSALLTGNELIQNHEYLSAVTDSINSYIMVFNLNFVLVSCNKRSQELFSPSSNDKITLDDMTINDFELLENCVHTVISTGEKQYLKKIQLNNQDNPKMLSIVISPFRNSKRILTGFILICNDVSFEYMIKFRNEGIKKYEFTSSIALGLSHDIKNPLMNIQSCTGYMLHHKLKETTQKELLNDIDNEIKRINTILDQLLSFCSVSTEDNSAFLNINKIIRTCILVISRQKLFKEINFLVNLDEDIPFLKAKSGDIYHVLLNIILNAVQSIEEKGTILISSHLDKKSKKLLVEVTDDGPGIDKENLKNILMPFYTTKKQGSGLGLYMSKKTLDQYQGTIDVESIPFKSTTFKVTLPADID